MNKKTSIIFALKSVGLKSIFTKINKSLPFWALVIGVASLVVAMAVVSGYETSLRKSVIDAVGHVLLYKNDQGHFKSNEIETHISNLGYSIKGKTPFYVVEGLVARKGKVRGVVIEGIDTESVHDVLNIKNKVTEGEFNLEGLKQPLALVGQGIAKEFDLKVGDRFPIVVPQLQSKSVQVRPKLKMFKVAGVTALGRHDYDSRYIMVNIKVAQSFTFKKEQITGWRLRLESSDFAIPMVDKIHSQLDDYSARSWWDVNANLFEAIKYEKPIIFLVILIIVLAAAFNITSSLFISVMKETKDIAILKAMGATKESILRIYTYKGLFIGFIGSLCGIGVGLLACRILTSVNNKFGLLPSKVYKITELQLELRFFDLAIVLLASLLVCYMATFFPAKKASRKAIVEGLRYE